MNKEKALSFAEKFGVILAGFEDDDEVVKSAVGNNGESIESTSDRLKKDLTIIKLASNDERFDIINYLERLVRKNPQLKEDDLFIKEVIYYDPYLLKLASNDIKDNETICEYCVRYLSDLINHVSNRLKKSPLLWKVASEDKNFDLVVFLDKLVNQGESFTLDDEFMRNAISVDASFLNSASNTLRDDKQLAIHCVSLIPTLVECLTDRLKDDYDVAQSALNVSNGDALFIFNAISDRLKKDPTLWEIANKDKKFNLYNYLGLLTRRDKSLLNNVEFMKNATPFNSALLIEATDTIKDNEEIVTPCVNKFGFLYNYVSKRLKNNKNVVKAAINGYKLDHDRGDYEREDNLVAKMYKNYNEDIRDDLDVSMFAVVSDSNNIKYVNDKIKSSTDIVKFGAISAINEYFEKAGNPEDKYVIDIIKSTANIIRDNINHDLDNKKEEMIKSNDSAFKNIFNDNFTDEERNNIYENLNEQFDMLDRYSNNRELVR